MGKNQIQQGFSVCGLFLRNKYKKQELAFPQLHIHRDKFHTSWDLKLAQLIFKKDFF